MAPGPIPSGPAAALRRRGEFAVVQLAWPGLPLRNVGVALRDVESDRLFLKLTSAWDPNDTDAEYLAALAEDLALQARQKGAGELLDWCEDTLSNVLRITDRQAVQVDSFSRTLERVYAGEVERVPVHPFQTHLPLYSLRAAAGKFGHEHEVEEEDWVPAPGRLNERMFVAHVNGRSMEPRIPDGSLNIFEAGVVGSRRGLIVLAELPGFADTTARYTVKKYSSTKTRDGDSWRHESVTLLPINPEFEPIEVEPDQVVVIARWVATLE